MPIPLARDAPSVDAAERHGCIHLKACRRLAGLADRVWSGCREGCLSYAEKSIYPVTLEVEEK
jgi:hypothetical protein